MPMAFHTDEGLNFDMTIEEWLDWSSHASFHEAREKARSMGVNVIWDYELPRTPEGFYPIQGGIEYAIARSLDVAPFADMIWMETKTADLPMRSALPTRFTRSTRIRCWRTTSLPPSTGTPRG